MGTSYILTNEGNVMISSEMKNMMLRDQILNDMVDMKKELEALRLELNQLKEVLRERTRL